MPDRARRKLQEVTDADCFAYQNVRANAGEFARPVFLAALTPSGPARGPFSKSRLVSRDRAPRGSGHEAAWGAPRTDLVLAQALLADDVDGDDRG